MHVCLFEPEIPQNAGTIARMCSCFDVPMHIIEPASFVIDDKKFKRSGMDYINRVQLFKHSSFQNFKKCSPGRIILLDVKAKTFYFDFKFNQTDCLMAGRESDGVPNEIFDLCDEKVVIPMSPENRSINVAISMGIVLSEALRQTLWSK